MSLEGRYSIGAGGTTVLPIDCPDCKTRLTAIAVNNKCIINFRVECVKCHTTVAGEDVWAEVSDKVADGRYNLTDCKEVNSEWTEDE